MIRSICRPSFVTCRLIAGILTCGLSASAGAVTQLQRGDTPPPIDLPRIDGGRFVLDQEKGRPVALLFGELYHAKTLSVCRELTALLADPRLADVRPACVLIVAQQAEISALAEAARQHGLSLPVAHDGRRTVFAAYQVSVLPSIVVLDREGKVVHALAGSSPAWRDAVTDMLLYAAGRLSPDQLRRTLSPTTQTAGSDAALRASRLTELAAQLARRGMHDMAAEKYQEALRVDAKYVPAHVGLGRSALQRRALAEAEDHFRTALGVSPESVEATLGLAYVETMRGGKELSAAEKRLRALLVRRPNEPEAFYLLGTVCEQSGRPKDAAANYKKAAELFLERGGRD